MPHTTSTYADATVSLYTLHQHLEVNPRTISRILEEQNLVKTHRAAFQHLTGREKEIIPLVVDGCTNSKIGENLGIARSTVETHRKNIKRKLGIKSPYQLTRLAQAFDLV
ncbi:MAG: helix-turn-helix transcriptional regulator [Bacteroidota bacterium]